MITPHNKTSSQTKPFILAAFSVLFWVVLMTVPTAHAQEAASVRIQPTLVEKSVAPGTEIDSSVTITNLSGETQVYELSVRKIVDVVDGHKPVYSRDVDETGLELTSWILLPSGDIEIDPGEDRRIPYRIEVPEDAPPGGHFAGIFATLAGESDPTNQGAAVNVEIVSIQSVRIAGDIREEADIRSFYAGKMMFSKPVVPFTVLLENSGNVLVRPMGIIEIEDMFGNKVDSIEVNQDGSAVFPESERMYDVVWESDGFKMGRFDAVVTMGYGQDSRRTIFSVTQFWILPMNYLLPILGGLLLFFLITFISMRAHVRRKLKEMEALTKASGKGHRGARATRPNPPMSGLMVVTIVLLIFSVVFFIGLFAFFA